MNPATANHDDDRTMRFARYWVGAQATVSAYVYGVVRDPHEADDVLQTVAEAAVRHFDEFDAGRSFTGWVLGIARHRVLHHFRTRRRDRHVFGETALAAIAEAHEKLHESQDARRAALNACLSRLSDRHRGVIAMRYGENLRPATIAERLDLSSGAVRQMLHRVHQSLGECIRRRMAGEVADG